jgi:hypothetical protein
MTELIGLASARRSNADAARFKAATAQRRIA